jgi:xylan 1,4-beta-xylosidase
MGGINKPSYYDYALLHKLGDTRIANASSNTLVTKRKDGSLVIALWNLVDPDKTGSEKSTRLTFRGLPQSATASISRVDDDHSNTLAAYKALGSPRYPTEKQVEKMNETTALPTPQQVRIDGGHLDISLQPNALVLIEIPAGTTTGK